MLDTDAAAEALGGSHNPFEEEAPAEVAEEGGLMLNDIAATDTDAEAAALDIFGGDSMVPGAAAEENPFEVDSPAEEEGAADIVSVEDAAEEEIVEVEEEEKPAPKKKEKKGWFGKKK